MRRCLYFYGGDVGILPTSVEFGVEFGAATTDRRGNCVLKSETENGMINCDQTAPENEVAGVNKGSFISLANRWRTGKNYSEECYNDTVNRALCAGINPAYALWAWVHESGASNYSIAGVEDFGIHFIPEKKNFDKQITAFLNWTWERHAQI